MMGFRIRGRRNLLLGVLLALTFVYTFFSRIEDRFRRTQSSHHVENIPISSGSQTNPPLVTIGGSQQDGQQNGDNSAVELPWHGSEGGTLLNFRSFPTLNLTSLSDIMVVPPYRNLSIQDDAPFYMALVITAKVDEDILWIEKGHENELANWRKVVYITDADSTHRQDLLPERLVAKVPPPSIIRRYTPTNKGNEAMAILSYIIDQYDNLPNITLFAHHHQIGWHNNDLLNFNMVEMIQRFDPTSVIRAGGYTNLRCHWDPGCPASLLPTSKSASATAPAIDADRKLAGEDAAILDAWETFFPANIFAPKNSEQLAISFPPLIAQPCCSQFAVSQERIRAVPLSHWLSLRKWLFDTPLPSSISGRVFEHLWHVLLLPNTPGVTCESMKECYCSLYRMCFESESSFRHWFAIRAQLRRYGDELSGYRSSKQPPLSDPEFESAVLAGEVDPSSTDDRRDWLRRRSEILTRQLDDERRGALVRGFSRYVEDPARVIAEE